MARIESRPADAPAFLKEIDRLLDDYVDGLRFFHEPFNKGRGYMFVMQHRLNSRYRNSVLKLKVAANCPDWETRLRIIGAASEEIIADHEFGGGLSHWKILENLGVAAGMRLDAITGATPLKTTQLAWNASLGVMADTHWLEGLLANVIGERINIPGYGSGPIREHGWFGFERQRWKVVFGLPDEKLDFFKLHEEADVIHSNIGWRKLAEKGEALKMEDILVERARQCLAIRELYLNGIADAGDALEKNLAAVR